jgi:hypothetical protein
MAAPNALPFQYQIRGQQLQYLEDENLAQAIESRDTQLEDYLGGSPWQLFAFATGWTDYGGYQPPRVRRLGDNVQLQFLAKAGTGATALIGNLPTPFRPSYEVVLAGNSGESNSWARVDVLPSGAVNLISYGATTLSWVALNQMFPVV